MEALGAASSVIAVVDLSAKVAGLCLQYSKEVKHAKDDINGLREQATQLQSVSTSLQRLLDGPSGPDLKASQQLRGALNSGLLQLERVHSALRPKSARQALSRLGLRSLKWPFESKEMEKMAEELNKSVRTISIALQIDQTDRLLHVDKQVVLAQLRVAEGAYFDSQAQEHASTCLPNTRTDLLTQIVEWAQLPCPETKPIFWLKGMAGTGKSTISRSIAKKLAESSGLGASFFFKKGEADRQNISKFFTTLAADLASRKPHTLSRIKASLEADPNVVTKSAKEQFDKLLVQPLWESNLDEQPVIFVVDALDECESDDNVKLLIRLFSSCEDKKRIKLFVTSRPELPLRLGFRAVKGSYQDMVLHEIPKTVIEHDISIFLRHKLSEIRQDYNNLSEAQEQLDKDWPGQANFDKLLDMAVPLFIVATTICRFISEIRIATPNIQLEKVLRQRGEEFSQLSRIYRPVLDNMTAGLLPKQQATALSEFRSIVGPIVVLATPLSVSTLSNLLNIPKDVINGRLALLHSVLSVPSSTELPVRLLHLSFRDYLVDRDELGMPFYIDEETTHAELASNCLRVLDALKRDICNIDSPGTPRATISAEKINSCLTPETQYACLYWPYHIGKAKKSVIAEGIVQKFLETHFLHWLEALALMDRAWESLHLVKQLQSQFGKNTELYYFLADAFRFLQTYNAVIDHAPLQLYCSLLLFAPKQSRIRIAFQDSITWAAAQSQIDDQWSQCVQTWEGQSAILSVDLSHDSTLAASSSTDATVRIWRVDTGECAQTFEHESEVQSVKFSHDSTHLIAGCGNAAVYIWEINTGECVRTLNGHRGQVVSVAFSHDSKLAASAALDNSVRVWNMDNGGCLQKINGSNFQAVCFSQDSVMLAVASHETVQIWQREKGKYYERLEFVSESIEFSPAVALAFSHDSTKGLSLDYSTILIWRSDTGQCIQKLEGHTQHVSAAMFSYDSTLVASASVDKTIRIWSTATGECLQILRGHAHMVNSIAFSHDSALLLSGSGDSTVRVWQTSYENNSGAPLAQLEAPRSWAQALSPDATLLVSILADKKLQVWKMNGLDRLQEWDMSYLGGARCAFSLDSKLLVSFAQDTTIQDMQRSTCGIASMWQVETGECLWRVRDEQDAVDYIDGFTISPDATLIGLIGSYIHDITSAGTYIPLPDTVLGGTDFVAQIRDAKTGRCLKTLKSRANNRLFSIAFSHDSKLVLASALDSTINIWDVESGTKMHTLDCLGREVRRAVFSPDAALVASVSREGIMCILDVVSGSLLRSFPVQHCFGPLRFNGDGTKIHCLDGTFDITVDDCKAVSSGFGLSKDRIWITWNRENWLWLPTELRPGLIDFAGPTVVVASGTRVAVIERRPTAA